MCANFTDKILELSNLYRTEIMCIMGSCAVQSCSNHVREDIAWIGQPWVEKKWSCFTRIPWGNSCSALEGFPLEPPYHSLETAYVPILGPNAKKRQVALWGGSGDSGDTRGAKEWKRFSLSHTLRVWVISEDVPSQRCL